MINMKNRRNNNSKKNHNKRRPKRNKQAFTKTPPHIRMLSIKKKRRNRQISNKPDTQHPHPQNSRKRRIMHIKKRNNRMNPLKKKTHKNPKLKKKELTRKASKILEKTCLLLKGK